MRKKYIVGVDFGTTYSSIFEFDELNKSPIGLTGSCSSTLFTWQLVFWRAGSKKESMHPRCQTYVWNSKRFTSFN